MIIIIVIINIIIIPEIIFDFLPLYKHLLEALWIATLKYLSFPSELLSVRIQISNIVLEVGFKSL